ncbi:acid protease [Rhizopogon vinicolor AM-OR11-026]|uniref:Acid protease n=1 Tax=Rhizopogon vinicolor AM-OR11-026 TaxID=1314800 RepID=A0A1B7N0H5_9AGAM|nr:acid protease [Rhizopogon vinicolor AM-OR11-026]
MPLKRLTGTGSHLDAGRARAAFLKSRASGDRLSVSSSNLGYVQYTTSVGVGTPPTYYNLVVDTGSAVTFVGTGKKYVRTSSSVSTGQKINVTYGTGYFKGDEYNDTVTLAPQLVITQQSIGDALEYADFLDVDGIIGFGPVDLTQRSLPAYPYFMVPTVMDNAINQNLLKTKILGVSFAPATSFNDTNGSLTYGGVDDTLYTGEILYMPVTETYPAAGYWGVNVSDVIYGSHSVIPQSTAGVVDTGTTLILIADDFFAVYMAAIPGAYIDDNTGLIVIPASSVAGMQPLKFKFGKTVLSIDASSQLIPQDQNTEWGGEKGVQYGVVGNLGANSGEGLDFTLGQKFMEIFYAVFDADENRVGFG